MSKIKKSKPMTRKEFKSKINKWKRTVKRYNSRPNKTGYRSDCSGLTSYLWDLPKKMYNGVYSGGPRTRDNGRFNLKYWSEKINKKDLRNGDGILVMKPSYHVVIFDKWANKEKTQYYIYEMCGKKFCSGFVHSKQDYPYTKRLRPKFKNPTLLRRNTRKINKFLKFKKREEKILNYKSQV